MYIIKRIRAAFKGKGLKNQPSKTEVERLFNYYRKDIFNKEALELFTKQDFTNLINVAHYSEMMGLATAIEAAFSLGYKAGKGVCGNENVI